MKTPLRLPLLLLAWSLLLLVLGTRQAVAQTATDPVGSAFSCDGTLYQIRQEGTTSKLYYVDRSSATYTTRPLNIRTVSGSPTNDLGVLINGLAYNSQDGYMYGIYTNGSGTTLPTQAQMHMYKIGQGGIRDMGVTTLPALQIASGTIDKNGNYYVSSQNTAATKDYKLYRFNLNSGAQLTATPLQLRTADNTADANLTFYDLALNPKDNLLYGVFQNGTLWRIDQTTSAAAGQALVTPIKATADNTGPVGTSFFDVAGNLFAYTNGTVANGTTAAVPGNFYSVDLSTGVYTQISPIDPANVSDGASCINPSFYVDVVKEVTDVVRNSATEYTVSFQFKVKNTGTQTLDKVQVSDFLWSGSATTTQTGSTFSAADATRAQSVTITSLSVSNNGTAPLVANSIGGTTGYTGVSDNTTPGKAGLLSGTQSLTAGQSATINLTVKVMYATAANVPTTFLNNQAHASALGGATSANGGFRLSASGSLVSPTNGNLQAADSSTDSGALPTTPNGDMPTPSPIYYQTAILGNVFVDTNYGGGSGRAQAASNGVGAAGARVELYSVSTTNNVDTYAFLQATTSDANGNYSFTTTNGTTALSANTTYAVRVVNSTVKSNRTGGNTASLLPVQTFRTDASAATTTGVTDRVGGEDPWKDDLGEVTSGNLPTSTTTTTIAQSLTKVLTPAAGPRIGIDFGYNFSTIVNTKDSGQGTLRQFILNSNALGDEAQLAQAGLNGAGAALPVGRETSIFMIPDGAAHAGQRASLASGVTNGVAVITPASDLPAITGANTRLDGSTQSINIGNANTVTLGSATAVGTAGNSFTRVDAPEVEIKLGADRAGLSITGAGVDLNGIALYGSKGDALTISGDNVRVTNNVLGATARTSTDPGAGVRTPGAQVNISGGKSVIISNNLIANAGQSGIVVGSSATATTISSNEVRDNGRASVTADGITIAGGGVSVTSNYIVGSAGNGIDMAGSAGSNIVTGNTITQNGVGLTTAAPTETAGVRVAGAANQLQQNIISSNYGAGIMVASEASATLISQNATLSNGTVTAANRDAATNQLGIDLLKAGDDAGRGTSSYFSLNANGKTGSSGANGLQNFPVITQLVTNNGNLQVTGFAPAGSTVEFFVADRTAAAFGQGQTYLFSAREGGTLNGITDGDAKTGSYSGVINGLDQGSETNVARFYFSIPLSSLSTAQQNALNATNARLTATATVGGTTTSEFSGSVAVKQNTPLPVELMSFAAQSVGQRVVLSWSTASEKNNDHFVVERSYNGQQFGAVGQVAGQGSSSQAHVYGLVDANVQYAGTVYYRLRQVDRDGTEALSLVQTVVVTGEAVVAAPGLYPNPATTSTTLDLRALPAGAYQVAILDVTGRVVLSTALAGGQSHPLLLDQLPMGSYVVTVRGSGLRFQVHLLKQ